MLAQGRLVGLIDTRVGTIHAQYMVYCTEYSGLKVRTRQEVVSELNGFSMEYNIRRHCIHIHTY
jgi:hypothetical protein